MLLPSGFSSFVINSARPCGNRANLSLYTFQDDEKEKTRTQDVVDRVGVTK